MSKSIVNTLNSDAEFNSRILDKSDYIGEKIIKRGIVIDVNTFNSKNSININKVPMYSVKASIIGEDIDVNSSFFNNEIKNLTQININDYKWYPPLTSLHNISIPELGEEILLINEPFTDKTYWISRVPETNYVSRYLAREDYNTNNKSKYGFSFDVEEVSRFRSDLQPSIDEKRIKNKAKARYFTIPAKFGDVINQGRSGSFIRHSFNSETEEKTAFLEIGILNSNNISYHNKNFINTIGETRTKTVHYRGNINSVYPNIKKKTNFNKKIIGPFQDGSYQLVPVRSDFKAKNIILNKADEIYNISFFDNDGDNYIYRNVLGEKLEDYQQGVNNQIIDMLEVVRNMNETLQDIMEMFLNHTHDLPEINIQIPDKEVSFKEKVRLPGKLVTGRPRQVKIDGVPVKKTINTPVGPKEVTEIVGGKTITVPGPSRLLAGRIKTVTRKKTISYDKIVIGGEKNRRITTSPETNEETDNIYKDIFKYYDDIKEQNDKFNLLSRKTFEFLSKHNFIN